MINRVKDITYSHPNSEEFEYDDRFKYLYFGVQTAGLRYEPHRTPLSSESSDEKLTDFFEFLTKIKRTTSHLWSQQTTKRFKWLILRSESYPVVTYQYFMAGALGYSIISTLIFMSVRHPTPIQMMIDIILQILFVLQIFITFITDFHDHKGKLVRDPKRIAIRYLKGWFIVDLVSAIPLRLWGLEQEEYLIRQVRVLKFPVVLSVLRVFLNYLSDMVKNHINTPSEIQLRFKLKYTSKCIELIFVMFFMIFTISGWFIWFSKQLDADDSFVNTYFVGYNGFDILLITCYFIVTTLVTVGYGDYVPQKSSERVFIIIVMLIGIALFAYLSGSFHSAIFEYHSLTSEDNLDDLNTWINSIEDKYTRLPKQIKKQITQHFLYYWDKDRLYTMAKDYWSYNSYTQMKKIDQSFLKRLPIQVTHQILDSLFGDIFKKFDIFFHYKEFQYELCFHIQPRHLYAGEVIVDDGKKFEELIIVVQGEISAGVQFGEFHTLVSFSQGRTILGDYSIFTDKPSTLIYKATGKTDTDAFVIPKKPLLTILREGYPEWYKELFKRSALREQKLRRIKQIWTERAFQQPYRTLIFFQAILMYTIQHNSGLYYPGLYKSLKKKLSITRETMFKIPDPILSDESHTSIFKDTEAYTSRLHEEMRNTYQNIKHSVRSLQARFANLKRNQSQKKISHAETNHTDKEDHF
jgi:hypothetical protein